MTKNTLLGEGKHNHRLKIGVMGSASGPQIENTLVEEKARELGREIAKRGHIFVNGACPGLPNDAFEGARESGGLTVGVSPAFSEYEHTQEYRSPHGHDIIIYTGMGFMQRDIINIRSVDGVVIIGGGAGTLNELTVAYKEGKPVGVLTNTGGISNSVPHIIQDICKQELYPNMVFDDNPSALLDKLEMAIRTYPTPTHEDGRVKDKNTKERG